MSDETRDAEDLEQLAGMYAGMTTAALVILRHAFKADEQAAGGASAQFARGRLVAIDAEFKRRSIAALDSPSNEILTFATEHPLAIATIVAAREMGLAFEIAGDKAAIVVPGPAFAYNLGLQAMALHQQRLAAAATPKPTRKKTKKTPTRRARTTARRVTPKPKKRRR